jgi:tRNA pseudouridine38-40 synthase
MKNYKIIFEYDGTNYNGFQKQGNTTNTIQEKFENILYKLTGSPIEIHASGRTDAGVHAKGQVANFHIDTNLSTNELLEYINRYLPTDIRVLKLDTAPDRFHSRLNAIRKSYSYHIDLNAKPNVFTRKYSLSHPEELDIEAMKEASLHLIGTHDFKSFTNMKKTKKSTIRTIEKIDFICSNNELIITYTGDGFLYNMVRILTGTLIQVGEGNISVANIPSIIEACNREMAGPCIPPMGLFLDSVEYPA